MSLNMVVKVHPVVLFTIVDSFERRNPDAERVIGTLLGVVDRYGVEITNCFCVPHNESREEVAVELDFAKDMYELHRKVNPTEIIVGWWATGNEITDHSLLIHDYYSRVATNAETVHLTVDTTLHGGRMDIKAYVGISMGVPNRTPGTMFTPVPVEITAYAAEVVGVNAAQRTKYARNKVFDPLTQLNKIAESAKEMKGNLDSLLAYVDDVINGKRPTDNTIGRDLMKFINKVPKLSPLVFEEMLNTNMKDLLMVIYLSQLTKVNVTLNEKLTLLASTSA